ncbi:YdcF family protein [Aquabacterium sp. A7-Y]|uniref:YdcF family protein n=1 Tax=Aquabacterium sp. A7-Y TaxID=1349605 RepID=UPI00223DB65B|nr:YdcF family protein [Aquabacterium sp. A7-Y]MCW7539184.1 YdcF family protein [Aquabacterium sp. A7-Y]
MLDDLAPYKPLLTALLLPPASLIVLLLIGVRLILPRRVLGACIVLLSVVAMWLTATHGFAVALQTYVLKLPPALGPIQLEHLDTELKAQAKAGAKGQAGIAVIVLGAGTKPRAPEYGVSDLTPTSMERLRYGVWLSKRLGLPLGFSGGLGWAQSGEPPAEARVAERIVQEEYGRSLRWVEDKSRDTRENAQRMAPLLREAGVKKVLLVTHGWHMRRAKRAFEEALGSEIAVTAAPVGLQARRATGLLDWLPSTEGLQQNRLALRELLGLAAGS